MRIVIFGLPYSPNLGDGVIADCLSAGIRDAHPGAEVTVLDLSGREDWGDVMVRNRSAALRVLRTLPLFLRQQLVTAKLGRVLDGVTPRWRAALAGADAVVIGGGQLFSDADLNFPLKIARAAEMAREAGVPVAVHAVGVSDNWTSRGRTLFRTLLRCDLRRVAVRDAASADAWRRQMSGGPAPEIARDPGLLAETAYGAGGDPAGPVGLCVTDPAILSYHADGEVAGSGLALWVDLARALRAEGHAVRLFCNGAAEDRAALAEVATRLGAPAPPFLTLGGAAQTSGALGAELREMGAVVAHRLHACILAHAFGRPAIGLGWDRKVESYFASIGAAQRFVGTDAVEAGHIARLLSTARAEGVDSGARDAVVAETRAGIAATLGALQ